MTNEKPYALGLLVGRFQTVHAGHEAMIARAVRLCQSVGVFVGSSQESRTANNPFSFEERKQMLKMLFGEAITVCPLPDIGVGNNSVWGDYVLAKAEECFGRLPDLLVSGREARRGAWFDAEKGIDELIVPKTVAVSASQMRQFLIADARESWRQYTNPNLWPLYASLRQTVLQTKEKTETDSL